MIILILISTPYLVHKLGADAYGLFSIIIVVIGYFSVLDLGLGAATVKYVADFNARGDYQSIFLIVSTSLSIFLVMGTVGMLMMIGLAAPISNGLLHLPDSLTGTATVSLYIASLGFFVNMMLTVFSSVPTALQRLDIVNKRNLVVGTLTVVFQVALLAAGLGLKTMVVVYVAANALGMILFIKVCRSLLPMVSLRPVLHRGFVMRLLRFGSMKFLNQTAGQLVFQMDKILIGFLLPISWVTYYVIPLILTQKLSSIQNNFSGAYYPAACELVARGEETRFSYLYCRTSKILAIVTIPIFLSLAIYAHPILRLWMGADFAEKSTFTMQILAVGYLIAVLAHIPAISSDAMGKPKIPALFSVISAFLNLGCAVLFIPVVGIDGAALAFLFNAVLQVPIFIHYVNNKIINIRTTEMLSKSYLKPFMAAVGLLAGPLAMGVRNDDMAVLAISLALSITGYLAMIKLCRVFDKSDMLTMRNYKEYLFQKAGGIIG